MHRSSLCLLHLKTHSVDVSQWTVTSVSYGSSVPVLSKYTVSPAFFECSVSVLSQHTVRCLQCVPLFCPTGLYLLPICVSSLPSQYITVPVS